MTILDPDPTLDVLLNAIVPMLDTTAAIIIAMMTMVIETVFCAMTDQHWL
jgi:hypothetical protein